MNSAGPTAIHERHRASGRRPSTATIACPNCGIHQPVEVEYDGDQGYGALPVTPCSVCHQDLCCFCDQASCECGLTVCLHCIVTVPDGTSAGLRLCKPCAQQTDPRCPACGEFARMMSRENSEQQWFECTAAGAGTLWVNIGSREHRTGSHRPGDFSVVHLLHAAEPSGSACREDDQFPSSA